MVHGVVASRDEWSYEACRVCITLGVLNVARGVSNDRRTLQSGIRQTLRWGLVQNQRAGDVQLREDRAGASERLSG